MTDLAEGMAYIDAHQRQVRPTEMSLPLTVAISPAWDYQRRRGGWYGRIDTEPSPRDEAVWECEHIHPTEDEAWSCVEGTAEDLAVAAIRRRTRAGGRL